MVANKSDFDLKEKQKILFGLYQGAACLFGFTAVGEAFAERYMYSIVHTYICTIEQGRFYQGRKKSQWDQPAHPAHLLQCRYVLYK